MKMIESKLWGCVPVMLILIANAGSAQVYAWPEPIIYQGHLTENNAPANGVFEFEVGLFDSGMNGSLVGIQCDLIPVSQGLFALDIATSNLVSVPQGTLHLELSVRRSGTGDPFTRLEPRQRIGSTPYSLFSINAASANSVAFSNITSVPESVGVTYRAGQGLAEFRPIFNPPAVEFSIATSGATAGQVLSFSGSKTEWKDPVVLIGQLSLPPSMLNASNAQAGQVVTYDGSLVSWKDPVIRTGAVDTVQLAEGAVNASKVGVGQLVKSLNGMRDHISLEAGNNISIATSSNGLTIAAVIPNPPEIFVQTAIKGVNSSGSRVEINNPACNNNPAALLLITPSGTLHPHVVGVAYDSATGKWGIVNQDGVEMADGATFNVMVRQL